MKQLFFIINILFCVSIHGQTSFPGKRSPIVVPESFSTNRDRVWETLSNLPIEKSDWRYDDLKKNYLEKWKTEIFGTAIMYVSSITEAYIETPSMYYATTPEGVPSRIELDSSKFTLTDDLHHCVEHELGHAAFLGVLNVPGWLLYLGDVTSRLSGSENSLPHERIVMALVVRRDIIDYYGLPVNTLITAQQLQDYIKDKTGAMDYGLKWLVETTREDRLLPLLNFENGYLVNEKYVT
jgi:hypothetical protein